MQNVDCCGCCEGLSAETPVQVYNRPGLKAINYRVGNYSQFRESLLTRLSTAGLPALRKLTTRDNDDFTIALLDAWACVSDVLTFYQERIANESYLGTATEQISILELARLIGYELRPGVAASSYLAFILDDTTGPSGQLSASGLPQRKGATISVKIDTGTRVQSVPGPNEKPQTFETTEPVEAYAEWNDIKPRLTQPQAAVRDNIIIISGTFNDLRAGDVIMIADGLKLKKIMKVSLDEEAKTTWLYLDVAHSLPSFTEPSVIPDSGMLAFREKAPLSTIAVKNIISKTWAAEDLSVLVQTQQWTINDLQESISAELLRQSSSENKVFVFRKRASVFGYNAGMQVTYTGQTPDEQSSWKDWDIKGKEATNKIYLDSTYEQILPGSYVAVQKSTDSLDQATVYKVEGVDIRSRSDYGLSSKSTVVTIPSSTNWWEDKSTLKAIRSITIHVQTVPLILAESPIAEDVSGDTVMLNRFYPDLKKGRVIILSGDRNDLKGASSSEMRMLKDVLLVKGFSTLVFDQPLAYRYIRKSVSINANVAPATHGETVKEVLGSGDYSKSFQKFVLKQPPLTFISADAPSGTLSTLEIRVNDLLWHEVSSLYEHEPNEHIYTTRQDDSGKTTVIFGDGINGSRLPTGQENIRATYRKGIGTGGLVKANQLAQLITRPLGVKGVTNPLPANGAEDREVMADAGSNARLTIYTLDRIVSLKDYEDFARAFAGISKSLANWTWSGQKQSIYITVAGYNGAAVVKPGKLHTNLLTAIGKSGIPGVSVTIDSYQARFFRVKASVKVHPGYIPEKVITSVEQQLRDNFSFAQRAFGQPVTFSEVITVMQNVSGVIAVDIDELYRSDQPAGAINDRLDAAIPRPGTNTIFAAELLTLDPKPVDLKILP